MKKHHDKFSKRTSEEANANISHHKKENCSHILLLIEEMFLFSNSRKRFLDVHVAQERIQRWICYERKDVALVERSIKAALITNVLQNKFSLYRNA